MSLPLEERTSFLEKVTAGASEAFRITQPGDPERMKELKATLPNIATAHKITGLSELHDVRMILTRSESYEMRAILLTLEMDLCGGG